MIDQIIINLLYKQTNKSMKSFVIFAIIATTVSAETGYTCEQEGTAWRPFEDDTDVNDAMTVKECDTACTSFATYSDQNKFDYCCFFTAVDDADATRNTMTCTLWEKTAVDGDIANVKVAKAPSVVGTATTTYDAWAWNAG